MKYIKLFESLRDGFNERKLKSTIENLQYDYDFDISLETQLDDNGDMDRFFIDFGPEGTWGWFNVYLNLHIDWSLDYYSGLMKHTVKVKQGDMDGLIQHLEKFVAQLKQMYEGV